MSLLKKVLITLATANLMACGNAKMNSPKTAVDQMDTSDSINNSTDTEDTLPILIAKTNCELDQHFEQIPTRQPNSLSASSLLPILRNLNGTGRDQALLTQMNRGNIPSSLKKLQPVILTTTRTCKNKPNARITLCVMPDYLSVGSDTNSVRVPLGMPAAFSIAKSWGYILPTTKITNAIHSQSPLKLTPPLRTPDKTMTTTIAFYEHTVEINKKTGDDELLLAGHKKDVVISNILLNHNFERVAIYGWHRTNGQPIQPLSTVHGKNYADYSHGVRLISQIAFVNDSPFSILDLLSDPNCAPTLSDEGALNNSILQKF